MQRKKRMAGAIAGIGFCILLGSGIALWEHFQGDEKEQQKMFGTLFAISASVVAIVFVLSLTGVLGFIG